VLVYLHENSGSVLNDKLLNGQLDMAVLTIALRSPGSPASRC
jgi:hypothetical protein